MADKSRERNKVDLFSDYGLDERQKTLSRELAAKSFRVLYLTIAFVTMAWVAVSFIFTDEIHPVFVAYSYFIAATVNYCIYAVRASKQGLINQITSFSFSTWSLATAVIALIGAVGALIVSEGKIERLSTAGIMLLLAAEQFIMYLCGRRNQKALDEQLKED